MPGRALKALCFLLWALVAASLTVPTRLGMASGPSNSLPLVRRISINCPSGGDVVINIATTNPVRYKTLRLKNPERIVVDLQGARRVKSLKSVYPARSRLLKQVRVGQWRSNPAIVRVVADLERNAAFSVRADASGIRIKLKPLTRVTNSAPGSRSHYTQTAEDIAAPHAKDASHVRDPKALFAVHQFADLSASLTAPDLPPHDRLIPVSKPQSLTASDEKTSPLAVVSGITIKRESNGGANIDIASTRSVPYRIFQLPDPFRLVIDLKNARYIVGKQVYPVDSSVLKSIRVAQWRVGDPAIVRVVADLEGFPIFDVYARPPGIRITLRSRPKVGPLIRNPFEFVIHHPNAHPKHMATQSNQATTAATDSSAVPPGSSFSDLKVIGYIEEPNSGIQAIISDRSNIYFVSRGTTIEKTFRVLSISANTVELQNIDTLQTHWIAYSP